MHMRWFQCSRCPLHTSGRSYLLSFKSYLWEFMVPNNWECHMWYFFFLSHNLVLLPNRSLQPWYGVHLLRINFPASNLGGLLSCHECISMLERSGGWSTWFQIQWFSFSSSVNRLKSDLNRNYLRSADFKKNVNKLFIFEEMFKVNDVRMVKGFVDFNLGLQFFLGFTFEQRSLFDYFCCILAVGLLTYEFIAFSKAALILC